MLVKCERIPKAGRPLQAIPLLRRLALVARDMIVGVVDATHKVGVQVEV